MTTLQHIKYTIAVVLIILFSSITQNKAFCVNNGQDGTILILTSYSEDQRRINSLVKGISERLTQSELNYGVSIEKLGYGPLIGVNSWHKIMQNMINKYDVHSLKAIILVGQEAWAVYLSLESGRPDVPFYGVYVSQDGVIIPPHIDDFSTWQPQSVNTKMFADSKGRAGAVMNNYDFTKNIDLIRSCYPRVKNIAFLSDNTYGGVSLQASFIKVMNDKYQGINPILLDGRKFTIDEIKQKIEKLPKDAVLLLGSWLVDYSGTYFITKEFDVLFANVPELPIFTISGLGFTEGYAIGGFVPKYRTDPDFIINDIKRYYTHTDNGRSYKYNGNEFICNESLLEKFNLSKTVFPEGTTFNNSYDLTMKKYQQTVTISIIIISLLVGLLLFILNLLQKIRKQNATLVSKSAELAHAKETAEKSDKLKSAFLANMSHEIRTPLNAIVGFSDMLAQAETDEQKADYSKIIANNSELLLKLVDEIVNFSKIESGLLDFKYTKFNISEYFREMKQSLSINKPEDVDLICEIPYYNCEIVYDKERLSQLVTNLVNNAFKFTPKGRVVMGFKVEKKGIVLYVSDTGIGIARENQQRIFLRFEKVDPFVQGAGLGLAVCKAIAEKSNGSIDVQSELGSGTMFNVHIPCEVTFSKDKTEEDVPDQIPETMGNLSVTLKILYAEDNESNSMLVKHILSDYQIVHVDNGKKAVEAMRNDWFDLVLMDIKMPEMDGLEAAAAIRQFDKATPIIALSAYAYDSDKQKAIAAGCNDFITKPFSKTKLFVAIEKLM
ncbi:MAG: response regulator [Bacteroidales bacterium]|nr:response regulator [Bacteroidales bacterium]